MKIVHISDTHTYHEKINIPECDLLLHSGDLGGRTNFKELNSFINWFQNQPAKCKIFIAGNHDIDLDEKYRFKLNTTLEETLFMERNKMCNDLLSNLKNDTYYLKDSEITYEGIKIYGSPYSPSFHKERWAFNADRGNEIRTIWGKIPKDTNILLTHTPPGEILDQIPLRYVREGETIYRGCYDINDFINKKLQDLKLHCFGHIHDNYGILLKKVSGTRQVLFSNGAVLDNRYDVKVVNPLIINYDNNN